jgi:hypothetical protein
VSGSRAAELLSARLEAADPGAAAGRRRRLELMAAAFLDFVDEERGLYLEAQASALAGQGEPPLLAAGAAAIQGLVEDALRDAEGGAASVASASVAAGGAARESALAAWALLDGAVLREISAKPEARAADRAAAAGRALALMVEAFRDGGPTAG